MNVFSPQRKATTICFPFYQGIFSSNKVLHSLKSQETSLCKFPDQLILGTALKAVPWHCHEENAGPACNVTLGRWGLRAPNVLLDTDPGLWYIHQCEPVPEDSFGIFPLEGRKVFGMWLLSAGCSSAHRCSRWCGDLLPFFNHIRSLLGGPVVYFSLNYVLLHFSAFL